MSGWFHARAGSGGARLFGRVGTWIARHPWYPIIFWVALLVVTLPFLSLLSSVTTNSETSLPTNSPSSQAASEFARLFPEAGAPSSSILLFYGPNLTDANGQGVVMNVTTALEEDRTLADVAAISSVYTEYASYLTGQSVIAGRVLGPTLTGVNASSELLWGPPTTFVAIWSGLVANGTSPTSANYPAWEATNASLHDPNASRVLDAFYQVFNTTGNCAADPGSVASCATDSARSGEAPLVSELFPASGRTIANATLASLGVTNSTAWPSVRSLASGLAASSSGLPAPFVGTVLLAFPSGNVPFAGASTWANTTVAHATLATEPLPVPYAIYHQYVAPAGTASIINVAFTVADSATNASGASPVYSDLGRIDALVPPIVRAHDSSLTIQYVQTGTAPLDLLTNTSVSESISLVLPITVGLLLAISMIYFRSPITPLVTFAGLGIALVLGLGATVLVGTVIGHVDSTAITLEEVFVLGVGTDYSVFLVARYREELVQGKSPEEAVVGSMSWAGQSVATSGSTAIIATLALAFSGVALLAQWGEVLSIAILITVLLSLTMVPAFLTLVGPRIFWPVTRDRFSRYAMRTRERVKKESTYFYRAGRATQRHPWAVVGIVLLVSVPLAYVALSAPISYDFYDQLPSGHPASNGLNELGTQFGNGFAVPSYGLVTFRAPLLVGNTTNATEFTDLAALVARASATPGIASVQTLIGPYGAPLGTWLNLSSAPIAVRANLLGIASGFVGTDGRTVLIDLVPSSAGLSTGAVSAVSGVQSSFGQYAASHPEITSSAFGGGAPTINDLATETAAATEFLIVAVAIGLIVVLLAVLRSWIIALLAVATIGLSISWAWAITYLVFQEILGFPIFFYVRTLLILLVLGLGIDYTIFLLTRVREERLRGRPAAESAVEAVARTGGIITAAALILACAFAALLVGSFTLIRAIGFSVAVAVLLDAMVVRTYLVPATLRLLGERAWTGLTRRRRSEPDPSKPA
jgi:putative drug exporter of the RND superfamily